MKRILKSMVRKVREKSILDENPSAQVVTEFLGASFLAGKANKIEAKLLEGDGYDRQNLVVCQKLISPGDVCLDVGANIGIYTTLMARWAGSEGRVHAFEPVAHIRRKLNLNVRINGLKNVVVNSIVLGESAGTIPMNQIKEGEFRAGTSTLTQNESVAALGEDKFDRVNVEMKTVDGYVSESSIERVNFVKVDIEGYELNFLNGASRLLDEHRPILLMEHNQKRLKFLNINENLFKDIFKANNYRCFELLEDGRETYFIPYEFNRKMRGINLACIPE